MWLLWFRTLLSGIVLMAPSLRRSELPRLRALLTSSRDMVQIIIFSICGLLAVQLTYFLAISNGNAVSATILQYLSPLILTVFVAVKAMHLPSTKEISTLVLAVSGTALLLTDGHFGTMVVPKTAVYWGLASACFSAFYTYYPVQLIRKHGSQVVLGTGLLFGGLLLTPFELTKSFPPITTETILLLAFIVLFGSALSFHLYLGSLARLAPVEAILLASAEPISAAIVGVGFLAAPFGPIALVGGVLTLFAVTSVAVGERKPNKLDE